MQASTLYTKKKEGKAPDSHEPKRSPSSRIEKTVSFSLKKYSVLHPHRPDRTAFTLSNGKIYIRVSHSHSLSFQVTAVSPRMGPVRQFEIPLPVYSLQLERERHRVGYIVKHGNSVPCNETFVGLSVVFTLVVPDNALVDNCFLSDGGRSPREILKNLR